MIEKFNEYISKFDTDDEEVKLYWYEVGHEYCDKIFNKFSNEEWKQLVNSFPSRSDIIKTRLIFCLTDYQNPYQRAILSYLINNCNDQLFIQIIYVIKAYDFDLEDKIREKIISRIDALLPKLNSFDYNILNDYKEKISRIK